MQYNTIFWIIVAITVIDFAWSQIRAALNRSRMSETLPPELDGIYEAEEYARQQQYQRANSKSSLVEGAVSTLFLLVILFAGALGFLSDTLEIYLSSDIVLSVVFVSIITIATTILSLPFSYYDTFVIEERFGFNKMTRRLFATDALKNMVISLVLMGVVVAVIVFFYHLTPQWFWLIAWVLLALFSVGIGYFYSQLIVPLFNKQTPLPEGELRDSLFELSEKTDFPITDVFLIDGSKRSTKANAYFAGFGKRKRICLYDTLLDQLGTDEITAILAHEIGHYKKRHVPLGMIIGTLLSGIQLWLMSLLLESPALAAALGSRTGEPSVILGIIAFGFLFGPVSETLSVGRNVLSRHNEYQADAFAARFGFAGSLISGLKKISAQALSNLTPHPIVVFWTYSHPTLLQRMRALREG